MLRENHVNRESKSLDIIICLYRLYEHESPSICNTTAYLSWLLHLEYVLGGKKTMNTKNCGCYNVRKHRETKNGEK